MPIVRRRPRAVLTRLKECSPRGRVFFTETAATESLIDSLRQDSLA